jgi:hypothetical protein
MSETIRMARTDFNRRHFLASVAGGAAAAATVAGVARLAPGAVQAVQGAAPAIGYRLTPHIRRFYRSTRL